LEYSALLNFVDGLAAEEKTNLVGHLLDTLPTTVTIPVMHKRVDSKNMTSALREMNGFLDWLIQMTLIDTVYWDKVEAIRPFIKVIQVFEKDKKFIVCIYEHVYECTEKDGEGYKVMSVEQTYFTGATNRKIDQEIIDQLCIIFKEKGSDMMRAYLKTMCGIW